MATRLGSVVLLSVYGILLTWWLWSGHVVADASLMAGLVLMPLLVSPRPSARAGWRWAFFSLICLAVAVFIPARTLHFFALGFAVFYLIENQFGRIGWKPAVAMVFMSPLVVNWITVFGFPVRLFLSKQAANALAASGFAARAEGNLIMMNGSEFAVDPACMGLTMVQVSFLFLLALLSLFERSEQKMLPILTSVALAGITGVLILIFNLLRIILLCLFGWMPGTLLHEAGGLAGLVIYVFLPLWWLVNLTFRHFGKPVEPPAQVAASKFNPWMHGILFGLILTVYLTGDLNHAGQWPEPHLPIDTAGMTRTAQQHGVVQYFGNDLLIYLKPIQGFYSSEHSPLICWEGSGFSLQESGETTLQNGRQVYKGVLMNENGERLYTSWWYENGLHATTSQWEWRKRDAFGELTFFLVNVTASDPDTLIRRLEVLHLK